MPVSHTCTNLHRLVSRFAKRRLLYGLSYNFAFDVLLHLQNDIAVMFSLSFSNVLRLFTEKGPITEK